MSFSILLAVAGSVGNRFGRKQLLLLGILLFGACSAWVGAAGSVTQLIVSRIALSIGGGLLFPLSTAVVGAGTSRKDLARLMSWLATESRNPEVTGRIHFGGMVFLTLAIGGHSLGVAWIPDHPPKIWSGLVVGSILVFAIFAWHERRLVTVIAALGGPEMKDYAPGVNVNHLIGAGLAAAAFVATGVIVPRRLAGTEHEDQSLKRNQATESSNHS